MKRSSQLIALAVVAAFLAQPLLGAAACWQMDATTGSCAPPCPMEEQAPPAPAQAESNDSGCCEITATEPAPLTSLVASPGGSRTAVPSPVELPGLSAPPVAVALPPSVTVPHSAAPSLSLLYCVLLI